MDLVLLFKVLWERKWTLVFVPLLAGFIVFVLTRGAKEQFKSSTQLSTGFTITDQVSITEGKFNLYEIELKFSNLIENFKSPLVMNVLGYELLLNDLTSEDPYKKITQEQYENNPFFQDLNLKEAEEVLRNKIDSLQLLDTYIPTEKRVYKLLQLFKYDPKSLLENITIQRINRTDYISITAVTDYPSLSAFMVNNIYNVYQRYSASSEALRTVESVQKWERLVVQKKEDLDVKTEDLRKFKSRHNLLNFEVESTSKIEQLNNLESEAESENRKLRRLQLEIDDIQGKIDNLNAGQSTNVGVSNAEILELRNKINDLNLRYQESRRTDSNIADSLRILRARLQNIASLSGQVSDQDKKESLEILLGDLNIQFSLAEQNLESINENIRQIRYSIGGYAGYEASVATLEKEVQLASQEYLWAQEKYNQAVDIATASTSTIRQVVKGQPATEPEPSKRIIFTALAMASSFLLCLIVIVLFEYIDVSIKSPSQFERLVNLNLIGSLIRMPKLNKGSKEEAYKYFELENSSNNGTITERYDNLEIKIKEIIREKAPFLQKIIKGEHHRQEFFNDQIRKIRFELSEKEKNIILITSTKKAEGKTEVIISLAEALSVRKKKVLIIDTNFEHNSLTQYYNAKEALGNFDLTDKNPKYTELVSKTSNQQIDILGCKSGTYSLFEIISKDDFFSQVSSLSSVYDYILIEGPAINSHSDTKELSDLATGVISVFSAKSVLKQEDKESILFLQNLQSKVIGAILNKVQESHLNQ